MKENNMCILLNTVRKKGPISRVYLARELGLTSPAITNIVSDLISSNLLMEVGTSDFNSVGRKPILVAINPKACYVMGIVLTTESITVVIGNFNVTPIYQHVTPIKPLFGRDQIITLMISDLQNALNETGLDKSQILGLGISAPGPLDAKKGILISPPNFPDWDHVKICQILQEAVGIPTVLDKETNTAALAEYYFSNLEEYPIFYISLFQNSIGGCIMDSNRIIRGFQDGAGDIGHMQVDINGPRCVCGQFGCLESIASGDALIAKAQAELKLFSDDRLSYDFNISDITLETIFRYADQEIPLFANIVDYAARMIAAAIGNVISILSPSLFVLGGTMLKMSPGLLDKISHYVHARSYPYCVKDIKIVPSHLGEDSFILGAMMLAVDHFQTTLCEK